MHSDSRIVTEEWFPQFYTIKVSFTKKVYQYVSTKIPVRAKNHNHPLTTQQKNE